MILNTLLVLHGLIVLSFTIRILVRDDLTPPARLAWFIALILLPLAGSAAYFLFGEVDLGHRARKRHREIFALIRTRAARFMGMPDGVAQLIERDYQPAFAYAASINGFYPVPGNRAALMADSSDYLDRLIADIDAATDTVHVMSYIWLEDYTGRANGRALMRAARRGVTCRVLLDALGSYGAVASIKRRLESAGIEVHDILPLRRRLSSSRVDLRNHRKIVVVDARVGYTGSQNMWAPAEHGRNANRELMVRVTGPIVAQLQAIFVCDWYLETLEDLDDAAMFPPCETGPGLGAQMIATGPDNPVGGLDLIITQAMYNASEDIVIVTPYFVPTDALLTAIRGAVLRGVTVRLITGAKCDQRLPGLAQRSYYQELLSIGVQIYLYAPEFLHAKHCRVDYEVSILGSSNMDFRSFELNAEIDLLCYDAALAKDLELVEKRYLEQSTRVCADDWKNRPLRKKVLENTARMMSELI